MSDDQGNQPSGGDATTERALVELRVALEQLATRMGAGFREDLAQIRAIAASVAERDLTGEIEALRVDVATLVGRDTSAEVLDELAAVRAELQRLASGDDQAPVGAQLAPLQATLDRIGSRLDDDSGRTQVLARFEALESRIDQLTAMDGSAAVIARLDDLAARLDALPSAQQVGNLSGDLRAHLADGLGGLDGDAIMRELAAVRTQLGQDDGNLLEQLQDNLADVASGEVVGALWDEVRQLRTDLPDLIAVPEPVVVPAPSEPDPQLASLLGELAALRSELDEGLVVEPSDALSASLDALRLELDGLRDALGELQAEPAAAEPVAAAKQTDVVGDQVAALRELVSSELGTVRSDVERLHSALDGLRGAPADQLAATRDLVAAEVDTVRAAVLARLDAGADRPEPAPAVVDPETLDLLLGEIRTAGSSGPEVIDAVRAEVDSLRAAIDGLRSAPASDGSDAAGEQRHEELAAQLRTIQAGVDDLQSRLETTGAPVDGHEAGVLSGADDASFEAIADQVAALRDFVASELDTLQQTVAARLDAAAEATASAVASAATPVDPQPVAPAGQGSALDPDAVALLRDEIRAAGAIGDQVVDALREELKALRRRIAVKASERVLDDQQLAQIADAVAARLAGDGAG